MSKPVIGIIGNLTTIEKGPFTGNQRAGVNNDYVTSVLKAGGVPMILPIIDDKEVIKNQVENVDGVLITGGSDVNSLIYGEEPTEKMGDIEHERDSFDIAVLKTALSLGKPVLGICRGLQIINVVSGGTLNQDLSFIDGSYIKHSQESKNSLQAHSVDIYDKTKLKDIMGESVITNSFHHQSVKNIAPGFIASAVSKDGVIEAIEKIGKEFVIGVQWHPEVMAAQGDIKMTALFEKFVESSANNKLMTVERKLSIIERVS